MRAALYLGCLLLAAGCGSVPATHYYLLQGSAATTADGSVDAAGRPAAGDAAIGVRPLQVDPPLDQDRFVYRVAGTAEVGFYAYHRWAAPLGTMLQAVIADTLTASGSLTGGAEPIRSGRSYRAHLEGRVRLFEELDIAGVPHVRLDVDLRLTAPDGEPLWSDRFVAETEVVGEEVGTLVQTLDRLLAREVSARAAPIAQALR